MKLLKTLLLSSLALLLPLTMASCTGESGGDDETGTAAETAVPQTDEPSVIYYEDYGAVGDGVTDDYNAILKAHYAANAKGLPVSATAGKTYYLGLATTPITVQTDTDWTGASFIIDDRGIQDENHYAAGVSVFSVEPSLERIDLSVSSLAQGAENLGTAPGVDCLVYIRCDEIKHYIRYGANANDGASQQEILLVSADGSIDPSTPVTWDYPTVDKCYAIPVGETPITLRGGTFTTYANEINPDKYISVARNINITRSNVTVTGLKHTVVQEKDYRAAYGGFFNITLCSDVRIEDCEIMCHNDSYFVNDSGQRVLLGSYEFLGSLNNNVTYQNCIQTNLFDDSGNLISQGCMGTNYCRNISMIGCTIARFDAHSGVYNVTIRDCTMERINVIGHGTVRIEDSDFYDTYIINLREDYGSMFAGDVIIRNVTMKRPNTTRFAIFNGAWYNHDFGYELYLPQTVTIENLNVPANAFITPFTSAFDSYEDVTKATLSDGTANANPLILPKSITVLLNEGGTRYKNNMSAIPFASIVLPEGETIDEGAASAGDYLFSCNFDGALSANADGFITTTSSTDYTGVGSFVLYDGNEVHSDMNLKQITLDESTGDRAVLFTGCGNPNNASKQANICIDVKPASGAQNMDRYAYEEYKGRDLVVSLDLMAVAHEDDYKGVTTDLVRLTSFYTPKDTNGNTVVYGETLLSLDPATFELSIPGISGRKSQKFGVSVSTEEFTNISVHIHTLENTYDVYVDGEMLCEGLTFLSKATVNQIGTYDDVGGLVLSEKENKMEDFCASYARLCNTNGWKIAGDLYILGGVEMYCE